MEKFTVMKLLKNNRNKIDAEINQNFVPIVDIISLIRYK